MGKIINLKDMASCLLIRCMFIFPSSELENVKAKE